MILQNKKEVVDITTEKRIDSRSTPANIDDIDLSGTEVPYRTAFSTVDPRLYTSGRALDIKRLSMNNVTHDAQQP